MFLGSSARPADEPDNLTAVCRLSRQLLTTLQVSTALYRERFTF
jgi:hypothetical protein